MASEEEKNFDALSDKFQQTISAFDSGSEAEEAYSILDLRQFEIMDALVDNDKKAKAFDEVLWETSRIHPHANTYYCKVLQKRLALTEKGHDADLERLAKDAYIHRRGVDFSLYGEIINSTYEMSKHKRSFLFKTVVNQYRYQVLNVKKREAIEKELNKISFYLEDESMPAHRKLGLIDDAIELIKEPYFKRSEANEGKAAFCDSAVDICQKDQDPDTAEYYKEQAQRYRRLSDNARRMGKRRAGILTSAENAAYMQKYRTDNNTRK